MLKLGRVSKVKVLFLALVYIFNFDLFEFLAAILEKGLFSGSTISSFGWFGVFYYSFFCFSVVVFSYFFFLFSFFFFLQR